MTDDAFLAGWGERCTRSLVEVLDAALPRPNGRVVAAALVGSTSDGSGRLRVATSEESDGALTSSPTGWRDALPDVRGADDAHSLVALLAELDRWVQRREDDTAVDDAIDGALDDALETLLIDGLADLFDDDDEGDEDAGEADDGDDDEWDDWEDEEEDRSEGGAEGAARGALVRALGDARVRAAFARHGSAPILVVTAMGDEREHALATFDALNTGRDDHAARVARRYWAARAGR